MTLVWILAATVAGGVLSVVAAAAFALQRARVMGPDPDQLRGGRAARRGVPRDAAARLSDGRQHASSMAGTILAGILLFFVLEKLVLWRHCHVEQCEAHDPPPRRTTITAAAA